MIDSLQEHFFVEKSENMSNINKHAIVKSFPSWWFDAHILKNIPFGCTRILLVN